MNNLKIIAVDDEQYALDYIVKQISDLLPDAMVYSFSGPTKALEFVKDNPVDIGFLDIEMFGMNGIELAKRFREANSDMSIVFVTGFNDYAVEAFKIHANGYLLKPTDKESLKTEINHILEIRSREEGYVATPEENHKEVVVQTFGNFEVYVKGRPVKFSRSKSKELFAYLVDRRGASMNSSELIAVLWEDREESTSIKSQLRTLVMEMISSFRTVGIEDIIIKSHNNVSVNTSMIDCDYYNFLKGDIEAINTYSGEYMSNYSWAEFTTGALDEIKYK